MLKLFDWDLSGLNRIICMHGLFSGVILRDNRSDSCDGSLCGG